MPHLDRGAAKFAEVGARALMTLAVPRQIKIFVTYSENNLTELALSARFRF
jgi:hypothetical protein